jgi:hypothetical protein
MGLSPDPVKRQRQLANLRPRSDARLTHGTNSQVVLAPLRKQADDWALDRWPWLDDTRRALVADLAARIRRVEIWADENDILFRRGTRSVRAHPIVDSADRWQARLDGLIRQLDAEQRERDRPESLIEQWRRESQS